MKMVKSPALTFHVVEYVEGVRNRIGWICGFPAPLPTPRVDSLYSLYEQGWVDGSGQEWVEEGSPFDAQCI